MIRALRPTDVLAYLTFLRRALDNEALQGAHGAALLPGFRGFVSQALAVEPRRETWVLFDRQHIRGLVSAKARFGADLWTVDQLIVAADLAVMSERGEFGRVIAQLLSHVCRAATENGVEKVFLRLDSASLCASAARQAGFVRYVTERIYRRPTTSATRVPVKVDDLRVRRPADHLALFQLYCSSTPAQVRQVEGMTLQEWRWNEGWRSPQLGLGLRRDFVVPSEAGGIAAWIWADLRRSTLRLLTDGRADVAIDPLIRFGLSLFPIGQQITVPVREYQAGLGPILENHGFECVGEHALFVRALALRVPDRKLVPVHVS